MKKKPILGYKDQKNTAPDIKENLIGEIREQEINHAIPLAIQELAYMIVNRIYNSPELLENLIKSIESWILQNLSKAHIEALLTAPTDIIHKEISEILLKSLTSIISELSELTKE